jgi:acetyl-CoA carboxylase biotin carboxyl carrier protein
MNIEEIKELISLLKESDINEIEVERGDIRVRVQRFASPPPGQVYAAAPYPVAAAVAAPPVAASAHIPAAAAPPAADANLHTIKSPIVGTFYSAASPDTPPFVKPGDAVTSKSTVCIIESMKLMNEIEAEVSGTIVACLVENGKPVEYGEALFTVRPN